MASHPTPSGTALAPSSGALPSGAWLAVVLLWSAAASNYLTRTMLTTMRGSIIEEIPMTDAQFGLLTSVFLWTYALFSPLGGFFADRFSRRSVVLGSILSWSAITWVTAYVTSFEQFLVLRGLLGISQALYIPAAVALIVDYHRGPTRALAAGTHTTGLVIGSMIGGVGGWIAEERGWTAAYSLIGIPNLLLGLALVFLLREPSREDREVLREAAPQIRFSEALVSLLRFGPFYFLLAFFALQGAVGWIIIGWMPTLMREQYAMGQGAAGFSALGYVYALQITGLLGGGYLSDRLSVRRPRARVLLPTLVFVVGAPIFFLTGYSSLFVLTALSLMAWGLALGFLGANFMPIVCAIVDVRYRATAVGITNAFAAVCGGLGVFAVGAMRDAEVPVRAVIFLAGFGALLCGIALWLVDVTQRRQGAKNPSSSTP